MTLVTVLVVGVFVFGLVAATQASRGSRRAPHAPFAPGNLVVVRVGNGAAALSGSAQAVFLDEYDRLTGALVQSVPMPTAVSGANRRLTLSGTATSEGALNLSSNGRFLTLAGYDAAVGAPNVSTSTTPFVNRVVARVDGAGLIDTTTVITDGYNAASIRSAVTDDGTRFWTGGNGGTLVPGGPNTGGTHFVEYGSTGNSTKLSDEPNHDRWVSIFGGQLYVTAGSDPYRGPNQVGTGLPTTAGQTTTRLPNASGNISPYGMLLLDRNPVVPGFDAMYVADQDATVGILKYSFDGTNWASQGSTGTQLGNARGATGITGVISGNSVVLYATMTTAAGNSLERFVDNSAFNAPITGTFALMSTAGANTVFRGLAFAPVVPPPPPTATASATATTPAGPCLRYSVALDGAQETPPNNSPATGSATIVIDTAANTLSYTVAYTGLTAPETAAHIHGFAPRGTAAGVLFPLPAGNPKAGVITYAEAQEANILAGLTYINIHSSTFPGGEIRGQIDGAPSVCEVTPTATATLTATATVTPTATMIAPCLRYAVTLDGAQENPPTGSTATGSGVIEIDTTTNNLYYNITFSGLSSAETAAHIHGFAPRGTNAGVLAPLPAGSPKSGVWNYAEAQEANILAGLTYINIHSTNFPGGEIRGQIDGPPATCLGTPTPTVPPTFTATATVTPTATVVTPTVTVVTNTPTVTPTATVVTVTPTVTPTATVATATATGSPIIPTITTPPTVTRTAVPTFVTTTPIPTFVTTTPIPTPHQIFMPRIMKN
jgi:hypothetical protein